MATYTTLDPIRHDGVDYAPGAPIGLDAKAAGPLLAAGAIAKQNATTDRGESPITGEATGAPAASLGESPAPASTADVVPIGTKVGKGKPAQ